MSVLLRGKTGYFHWCPACEEMHPLPDGWKFNGDVNTPSFEPSFLQTFGDKHTGAVRQCHYFIRSGQIQFCFDSWHKRSDIVAMPPIPEHLSDTFGVETQD